MTLRFRSIGINLLGINIAVHDRIVCFLAERQRSAGQFNRPTLVDFGGPLLEPELIDPGLHVASSHPDAIKTHDDFEMIRQLRIFVFFCFACLLLGGSLILVGILATIGNGFK